MRRLEFRILYKCPGVTFRLLELDWIFTNTGRDIIYANVKFISLTVSVKSYSTVIEFHFTKGEMSGPSSTKDILKLQENASMFRMVSYLFKND